VVFEAIFTGTFNNFTWALVGGSLRFHLYAWLVMGAIGSGATLYEGGEFFGTALILGFTRVGCHWRALIVAFLYSLNVTYPLCLFVFFSFFLFFCSFGFEHFYFYYGFYAYGNAFRPVLFVTVSLYLSVVSSFFFFVVSLSFVLGRRLLYSIFLLLYLKGFSYTSF